MNERKVTVIGAGLIGGSICLAARRQHLTDALICVDLHPPPADAQRFCDRWVNSGDQEVVLSELRESSLVFLCTPVRTVMAQLIPILDATNCPVTDCGSTKLAIESSAQEHPQASRFVPGHPMAGHPEGGLPHATERLFDGRRWILCPDKSDPGAVARVRTFVEALGAEVAELDAALHDRSVALTSHLPQVVASALSVRAHARAAPPAAGPGFASATRVAGGAASMWRDIFETNAGPIGDALIELGHDLQVLGESLGRSDCEPVLEVLSQARELRARSGTED